MKSLLYYIIEYNLRLKNIQIPFPQRDLWLKNPEVILDRLMPSEMKNLSESNSETKRKFVDVENYYQESEKSSIRDLLKEISFFSNFDEVDLRKLVQMGYRKHLKGGEILIKEGEPGDAFYIVLVGSVEIFVEKLNKTLNIYKVGDYFGEVALMLRIPRTATVKTIEDSIFFCIGKSNFETFLKQKPELENKIIQGLEKYKDELERRKKELKDKGLLTEDEEQETNIMTWASKRIKRIFGINPAEQDKK